jgi:hypothetical protein
MRNFIAAIAAASLLTTSAIAAAPLAPGKPAGLKKAQDADDNTVLYIIGIGAVAAGIAILASDSNDNNGGSTVTPPTTTTTTTSSKAATTST